MSHVLDKFKFCPVCGSPHFEINNIKSKKCKDCGFSYYLNASSATVALIVNEKDELLVVRRKNDPGKDMLDMRDGSGNYGSQLSVQLSQHLSLFRLLSSYARYVFQGEGQGLISYRSDG